MPDLGRAHGRGTAAPAEAAPAQLRVSLGQYSDRGRKQTNQDFHGACMPREPTLSAKGIAIALADGISSSNVSRTASEVAVKSFLEDYYCTSDAWSVKKSAQRVLTAANYWLYAQTRQSQYRFDKDRGYVCALSAMVIKSTTAHIFHVGDARIYRLRDDNLEQLTNDHRVRVSQDQSYLARALGIDHRLEIDYRALPLEEGDVFLLATDGVYEFVEPGFMIEAMRSNHPDAAASAIAAKAYERGSGDNLTVQVVRVDRLPRQYASELHHRLADLPFPPLLRTGELFEGYRIVRELYASHRSHVYLATDGDTGAAVALKIPSIDRQHDPAYLERFLMEDWIARRIDNPHVLRPYESSRRRGALYVVTEFIDGRTLAQWMIDNPKPELETVRGIVEQIARGLQAFHRLEMLHQDLRPDNIMIDRAGTVKIIDFGSTRVAGLEEIAPPTGRVDLPGTALYTAPEYFLGEGGTTRSDLFSLGVIAYQLLSGRLPYGTGIPKARGAAAQRRLAYRSVLDAKRDTPVWMDAVLAKAVHLDPDRRYEELSEFVHALRRPSQAYLDGRRAPLIERNPVGFWKGVAFVLAVIVLVLVVVR